MNQIFRGFCISRFVIGPLHYLSSRSDFGIEVAEIFVIENRLPDLLSREVGDSPTFLVRESAFKCLKGQCHEIFDFWYFS
jgi:hypothetical protein